MKNFKVENFVKGRIKENKKLFTEKELNFINNDKNLIKKIYILGVSDGKKTYEQKI